MQIPYKTAFFQLWLFFQSASSINNFVIISALFLIVYLSSKILAVKKEHHPHEMHTEADVSVAEDNASTLNDNDVSREELPTGSLVATAFFCERVASAFPGVRGLEWINSPSEAVERLNIMLHKPLKFKPPKREAGAESPALLGYRPDPIWWLRAGLSMQIEEFEVLSKTKCLMNWDELEIDKLAVFHGDAYYRDFVYIETKPEKPIGLYVITDQDITEGSSLHGFYVEEYALFNNKPIKRTEYDDGAAVFNNKVVKVHGAELRRRFLTKYNFIIAAANSPYNSKAFDRISQKYFNGILEGACQLEDMLKEMKSLPKHAIL